MSPFIVLLFLSTTVPLASHAQTVVDSDGDPVVEGAEYYLQVTHMDYPERESVVYVVPTMYEPSNPCPRILGVDPSGATRVPIAILYAGGQNVTLNQLSRLFFAIPDPCVNGAPLSPIAASSTWRAKDGNFFVVAGDMNAATMYFKYLVDSSSEPTYRMRVCSNESSCSDVGWVLENDKLFLVAGGNTFGFKFVKAAEESSSHIRKYSSS